VPRSCSAVVMDADLMVRPGKDMNHIAWQLGHLISGENSHINQVSPGSMPSLPDGFAEAHTKETACRDDPSSFLSKTRYIELMEQQRAGTLTALAKFGDDELLAPAPESISYFGPTVGSVFSGEASHWMMHAGQWAVVRRKLGRPPLF